MPYMSKQKMFSSKVLMNVMTVLAAFNLSAALHLPLSKLEVRGKRSDDGGPLEAIVQQLSQQVNVLNAQVAALKSQTAVLEKTVAFYATSANTDLHTAAHGTLVLDLVKVNVGNAYDSLTGVFTVPVAGLYDVQLTYMSLIPTNSYYHASIYVNGAAVNSMISDARGGLWDLVTSRVLLHFAAGQKVYVANVNDAPVGFHGPYTSLSGFLIKADQ